MILLHGKEGTEILVNLRNVTAMTRVQTSRSQIAEVHTRIYFVDAQSDSIIVTETFQQILSCIPAPGIGA